MCLQHRLALIAVSQQDDGFSPECFKSLTEQPEQTLRRAEKKNRTKILLNRSHTFPSFLNSSTWVTLKNHWYVIFHRISAVCHTSFVYPQQNYAWYSARNTLKGNVRQTWGDIWWKIKAGVFPLWCTYATTMYDSCQLDWTDVTLHKWQRRINTDGFKFLYFHLKERYVRMAHLSSSYSKQQKRGQHITSSCWLLLLLASYLS